MVDAIGSKLNYLPGFRRLERSKSSPVYARLPLVEQLAQKTLKRVRHPEGANLSESMVYALNATDVSSSFLRHILALIPAFGPRHSVVTGLSGLSSSIGLVVGSTVLVGNGIADFNKSQKIGDAEGAQRAGSQIASGTLLTNASALSLAYALSTPSLMGLSIAADVFYGLGSLLSLGVSGWSIYRASLLRSRMNAIMASKHLNEKERVIKTLEFLKDRISPNAKEKEAILQRVEKLHPEWDSSQKLAEVKRKISDLAEVKARYFKRRTNQKMAERLLMELDKLLWHLRSSEDKAGHHGVDKVGEATALAQAKNLIGKVLRQNLKSIVIDGIIAISSLIALCAVVIGNFLSMGALSFALYAISSAIALVLLLYPIILDKFMSSRSAAKQAAMGLTPVTVITSGSN
jgi:predicted metalloprotease